MVYTISPCLIEEDKTGACIASILFIFSNKRNPFKVAKDINGKVIKIYESTPTKYKEIVKTWLEMMANIEPENSFEPININIDNIHDKNLQFVKLCKETIGSKNLIVFCKQRFSSFDWIDDKICYEGTYIEVLDKNAALHQLNTQNIIYNNIKDSQFANRDIIKSKNH